MNDLIQISEPAARRSAKVVGIDLGTTNSLVATVSDGKPRCLAIDSQGGHLLPSVVEFFAEGAPLVGKQALADAPAHPADTIVSVKRFMGRGPGDEETTRRFTSYRFAALDGPVVRFAVAGGREVTPVEVSAEILKELRKHAELELGGVIDRAVITVPAYFDDAQRQATKDAGRLAGLEVLRLLNEPTAAALAYGLDKRSQGTFAVFDLGGGTFDISILTLSAGVFEVKATAGDTALGGDDFDRALATLLLDKAGIAGEPANARGLLGLARRLKHELTQAEQVTLELVGQSLVLTRSEFEKAITPIVSRTVTSCRRAMKDAGLRPEQLDGVILVGGATRTPLVRQHVAQLFQQQPLTDIDPDEVVALGAAVQADLLAGAGPREDVLLLDVIPLSLGLELMGGVVEKIIPRNSTIPTAAKQTFTTYADGQTGFDLHVVQGERETAPECRSLARFQLGGLPAAAAGMARLDVTFLVDADGILHVTARDQGTGKEASIKVKPSYGLSDEEIERMLLESFENAESDVKLRLLAEARVEAQRILQATARALAMDGALLDVVERAAIDEAMARLEAAAGADDHGKINQSIKQLDEISNDFAKKRMNRELERAMTGRSIGEVESKLEEK